MGITKLLLFTNRAHYCAFQEFKTLYVNLLHSTHLLVKYGLLAKHTGSRIEPPLLTLSSSWPILYSEPAFLDSWREACLLTRYIAGHPRLHPFSLPGARCLSIRAPPPNVDVTELKHPGGDLAAGDPDTYRSPTRDSGL